MHIIEGLGFSFAQLADPQVAADTKQNSIINRKDARIARSFGSATGSAPTLILADLFLLCSPGRHL